MTFRAPKYSCTICGKVLRRNKQHFNHVMKCKGSAVGHGKTMTLKQIQQEYQAPTARHPYNVQLLTGNRHYNTGFVSNKDPKNRAAI